MVQIPDRDDERMIADAPGDVSQVVYQGKIDAMVVEHGIDVAPKAPQPEPAQATQDSISGHGRRPAVDEIERAMPVPYRLDAVLQQSLARALEWREDDEFVARRPLARQAFDS